MHKQVLGRAVGINYGHRLVDVGANNLLDLVRRQESLPTYCTSIGRSTLGKSDYRKVGFTFLVLSFVSRLRRRTAVPSSFRTRDRIEFWCRRQRNQGKAYSAS